MELFRFWNRIVTYDAFLNDLAARIVRLLKAEHDDPEFISQRKAFEIFGRTSHGFLTNEATLLAIETRTSAPVRIVRTDDTLCHVRLQGLYPCGEGAGYAGGIVSAAIDGERCAEAVAAYLHT